MSDIKVGDWVRCVSPDNWVSEGAIGKVEEVKDLGGSILVGDSIRSILAYWYNNTNELTGSSLNETALWISRSAVEPIKLDPAIIKILRSGDDRKTN